MKSTNRKLKQFILAFGLHQILLQKQVIFAKLIKHITLLSNLARQFPIEALLRNLLLESLSQLVFESINDLILKRTVIIAIV